MTTVFNHAAPRVQPDIFVEICGSAYVLSDPVAIAPYGSDQTSDLYYSFDVLVKPGSAQEVSEILKICHAGRIPVTPRGGGSGVTGGSLPVRGGVVLSLERLNTIIEINPLDGYVMAESGVITENLCNAVEAQGLYFPVPPSSSAISFIGGNVAENAGSVYSCKYGTTSQYVLNLEVVLPTGEIIWTGSNVSKNATGLNLTQLFAGSEGILGVITKVVYRLLPKPAKEIFMLAAFSDAGDAYKAILALKCSPVRPSVLEWIGPQALQLTAAYLNEPLPLVTSDVKAHLLVGLQYPAEAMPDDAEAVAILLEKHTAHEILIASDRQEKEKLWKLRHNIGNAMTHGALRYRDIDICLPMSWLWQYIRHAEAIGNKCNIPVIWFGHASDGNLHTMLLINEASEEDVRRAVAEIYSYAIDHGGVISGEHGIGMLQREFMSVQFASKQLDIMKRIKLLFDPHDILNPGKVIP